MKIPRRLVEQGQGKSEHDREGAFVIPTKRQFGFHVQVAADNRFQHVAHVLVHMGKTKLVGRHVSFHHRLRRREREKTGMDVSSLLSERRLRFTHIRPATLSES